jgi:hypothetical protein
MYTTCDCGKSFTQEESSGSVCYRCKLDGLSVTFVGGGGYGREAFHSQTVLEGQTRMMAEAKSKGIDAEPVPQRAELI